MCRMQFSRERFLSSERRTYHGACSCTNRGSLCCRGAAGTLSARYLDFGVLSVGAVEERREARVEGEGVRAIG
jgi:hypothetical protein